jgi:hypothetical protein
MSSHSPFEIESTNPIARAHARPGTADSAGGLGRVLVFAVVIPLVLFLVSNPLGWLLLLLLCLGGAAAVGVGAFL